MVTEARQPVHVSDWISIYFWTKEGVSEAETTISDEVATAHVPILANTLKIGYFFYPNIRGAPELSNM